MALTDESGNMVMPVSPMYGGNGGSCGFGGDWAWIILLLLLGWGNNGFGGNRNAGSGVDGLYPWMNQQDTVNNGFRNAAISGQLDGIQAAVNAVTAQLCQSFANVETGANARQMAMMQSMNALQSQFAQCCCEQRLATANLQSTILSENCADRQAVSDGVQKILDKLCDQELQAERRENANLRTQLNMANLAASQTAQTAQILADNSRQTVALEQYLNPTPIPAYVVQNPNCCQQYGCGCGCGA